MLAPRILADPRRGDEFEAALLSMDRGLSRRIFLEAVVAEGAMPSMEGLVGPVLDRIGTAWESGRLALSQVYMAGRICEELALEAMPADSPRRKGDPRLALVVFEDHHLLGKRMVQAVLRDEGYAVADWGQLGQAGILARLRDDPVDILLVSCLMLSSALRIGDLGEAVRGEGLPIRIVVGGAPFRLDPELWREVGADAMGSAASQVCAIVRSLMAGQA